MNEAPKDLNTTEINTPNTTEDSITLLSTLDLDALEKEVGKAPAGVVRYRRKTEAIDSEDYIKDILTSHTRQDLVNLLAHNMNFFARFMVPEVAKIDFPPLMVSMWNLLVRGLIDLIEFVALAQYVLGIPRGFAKTTFVKLFIWYSIFFSHNNFVLIISSVEDNASAILKDVKEGLKSEQVRKVFGSYDYEKTVDRADELQFRLLGKKVVLKAKGAYTSVRGLNIDHERPNLIVCDDMQTEENAKSDTESTNLLTWFISTLKPACSPEGAMFIYLGNTYAYPGSIMTKLIQDPSWVSLTLGAIRKNGKSLWPELHPTHKLISEYNAAKKMGKGNHWLAQFMNAIDIALNVKLDLTYVTDTYDKLMKLVSSDPNREAERSLAITPLYSFVMIDPASQRKNADDVAIGHFNVTHNEMLFVTEAISRQMNPEENITTAIEMAMRNNTCVILIEGVAYQETLKFWMKKYLKSNNIDWFQILTFTPGKASKNSRIGISFEVIQDQKIIFHPEAQEIYCTKAKIFDFNKTDNSDDILDLVASAHLQRLKQGPAIMKHYNAQSVRTLIARQAQEAKIQQGFLSSQYLPV